MYAARYYVDFLTVSFTSSKQIVSLYLPAFMPVATRNNGKSACSSDIGCCVAARHSEESFVQDSDVVGKKLVKEVYIETDLLHSACL